MSAREIDALRAELARSNALLRDSHERMAQVVARSSRPPQSGKVQSIRAIRAPRMRVLVAEDDPLTARVYRRRLDPHARLVIVATLADAVPAIETGAWDVVIVDLDLRGENGAILIPIVREHCPNARVIVATGMEEPDVIAHLAEAGIDPSSVEIERKLLHLGDLIATRGAVR